MATTPDPTDTPRVILLTGLPSQAPRWMLARILEQEPDATVYAVVPRHLIERLEQRLEPGVLARITVLTGDTAAMDLGLSGDEYTALRDAVTDIYHMATIFYLGVDYEAAYEVNVRGTLNVLQTASEMPNLRRFNHLSSAFVAGNRTGVVLERELEAGQGFRNAFEKTRYEGEIVVRRWREHLPITIYRPSLIVGDSRTGAIDRDRMDGPYVMMRAMLQAPAEVPIPLPGKGDKPLNLVPIDWVCDAIYRLSRDPRAEGGTYHLTDPNPLPARQVFELVAAAAGRAAPRGRLPYRAARMVMRLPGIERVLRRHRQFFDDFNQLTLFNAAEATRLLGGRTCPPFPDYVDQLVAWMMEHE